MALLLCAVMGVLAGCSGNTQGIAGHPRPVFGKAQRAVAVGVAPRTSLLDQPLTIRVTGLQPGQTATLDLDSTDSYGYAWKSSAVYRADTHGTIDLDRSPALSGSYSGADPMGLIDSMTPSAAHSDLLYFWDGPVPQRFTIKVHVKTATIASATFWRALQAVGVTSLDESLTGEGFVGQYWLPSPDGHRHPAVLEFGGSEGGLDGQLVGAALASHGYPALDLAYFKEPGLPASLSNIPLDYFAKALIWLGRQPQVDPRHIYTLGGSRGSEAALLLGVYYPNLVHGVIATSPSNVAICSYPGCGGPAWTFHGRQIPYTRIFDNPNPSDNPQAVIPVERVRGPIFLACGGADQIWTSCDYAQTMIARLNASHDPYIHVLSMFPAAGHAVDFLIPYEPESPSWRQQNSKYLGQTPLANYGAWTQLWPRLLAFLADSGR